MVIFSAACDESGGDDGDGPNPRSDAGTQGSPLEGRWEGTTDEGGPVEFDIASDGRLVRLAIELEVSVGNGTCTGIFEIAPGAAVDGTGFEVSGTLQNPAGTVNGSVSAMLASGMASGTYDIDNFALVCGGSFSFGTGGPSGTFTATNRGGKIEPGTDGGVGPTGTGTWAPISSDGAPSPRSSPAAVWSGSEMIVWGGYGMDRLGDGARYDPANDRWTPMTTAGAPSPRNDPVSVWSGSEMIVWGSGGQAINTGARYDPANDRWTPMSTTDAPSERFLSVGAWTGTELVVWGGFGGSPLNTGGRYDPALDRWTPTSTAGAPAGRNGHAVVWTGSELIVWGGFADGEYLDSGGRYDPATDSWAPISAIGAPSARNTLDQALVWTGTELLVWGGFDGNDSLRDGARYDPAADTWRPITANGAPPPRASHSAIWTGSRMILWGGRTSNMDSDPAVASGGIYDPIADAWLGTASDGAPSARSDHAAIWTGSELIVWGGYESSAYADGARFRLE
jgi:N-acetylneuraminic acid mutarotase